LLGRKGEKLAASFLRRRGYRILYRRFRRTGGGEVDIVCRDGPTLVFVEVKTRASVVFGWPIEAVNAPKQRLIARGALAWLRLLDNPAIPFRFDVVEVIIEDGQPPRLNLVQAAFTLPAPYLY
jgi:putative endonuclease